ncbi:hypothetical protein BGW36DRAFT_458186 [Talaromyces proteolyticus]|uniref:Major facilitator superfamily (MFS) profile domain-containing protein n=1 Tax=Talaromyces proteolyticus TaxID=1131652 RepID=A0AAD4L5Q6_9EURO|nr:uncharacterized protein BGW36DRAFT_458186 [Talaromyces proteolyticus]KAH8704052.1 hypothetical protein BGW36DRAFT_458186 [Talaromyces proteolyticus]
MEKFFARIGDAVRWYPTGNTYEEKILIFKIDLWCWSMRVFYSLPTTAYVSGMRQDLDLYGNRVNYVNATAVVSALVNAYIAPIYVVKDGNLSYSQFFAFISIGRAEGALPFIIAWAADSLSEDLEARAITLATYNCLGEVTSLVVPLVAWAVSKGPRFFGGCIWALIISVAYFTNTLIIVERRSQKRKAEKRIIENESSEITNDYEKKVTKSSAVVETAPVR